MAQGVLPFQYVSETTKSNMTSYAGLGIYLDLLQAMKVGEGLDREVGVRRGSQGYSDRQQVISLMLLNLSGGRSVGDLDLLAADEGLVTLLKHAIWTGKSRSERRALAARWRHELGRGLPSATASFEYLKQFHDESQEVCKQPHYCHLSS